MLLLVAAIILAGKKTQTETSISHLRSHVAMTVAGCSNYSAMTSIYVLGLSYRNSTNTGFDNVQANMSNILRQQMGSTRLGVRVGYFGMCARQPGGLWLCSSNADELVQQIGSENDPLALIKAASKFKGDLLFSAMLLISVALSVLAVALLATFPGWHEEKDERTGSLVDVKPFPSRPVSRIIYFFCFLSSMMLLVASLWQHVGCVGAATLADTAYFSKVKTEVGSKATTMIWASFILTLATTFGMKVMIGAIEVLDRLTDD